MKEYKILSDYAEALEEEVNKCSAEGYEIERVLQQNDSGSQICIIMVRDIEAQKQKQVIHDLVDSIITKVSSLLTGEVDMEDFDEEELKKTIAEIYKKTILN